jgi:hypothetical protein
MLFFFFGLPTGSGRRRRPIARSSLLRKLSPPNGLPVCVREVPLVQSAGIEPPLPQVAAAVVEAIDVLGVAKVRPADGLGQRIFSVGDRNEMNVIAHQAMAAQRETILVGLLFEQRQIDPPVVIHEKHLLAVVPTLGDMVSETNGNGSG